MPIHRNHAFKPENPKTQTPLHGFVVDLLYNKLYNKSTTSRHVEMLWICCGFVVDF